MTEKERNEAYGNTAEILQDWPGDLTELESDNSLGGAPFFKVMGTHSVSFSIFLTTLFPHGTKLTMWLLFPYVVSSSLNRHLYKAGIYITLSSI